MMLTLVFVASLPVLVWQTGNQPVLAASKSPCVIIGSYWTGEFKTISSGQGPYRFRSGATLKIKIVFHSVIIYILSRKPDLPKQ